MDEEEDARAAGQDDKDVGDELDSRLDEEAKGPDESKQEGENEPVLHLAEDLHRVGAVQPPPRNGRHPQGLDEDGCVDEEDHGDGADETVDPRVLMKPTVSIGVNVQVVVVDSVGGQQCGGHHDEREAVANDVPHEVRVLGGVHVSQLVGLEGLEELESFQKSPGKEGEGKKMDRGGNNVAEGGGQAEEIRVEAEEKESEEEEHHHRAVFHDHDPWTRGQSVERGASLQNLIFQDSL